MPAFHSLGLITNSSLHLQLSFRVRSSLILFFKSTVQSITPPLFRDLHPRRKRIIGGRIVDPQRRSQAKQSTISKPQIKRRREPKRRCPRRILRVKKLTHLIPGQLPSIVITKVLMTRRPARNKLKNSGTLASSSNRNLLRPSASENPFPTPTVRISTP